MNHKKTATEILANVGGKENVLSLTHCITRLRFVLADEAKADTEAVEKVEGVIKVIKSGGQYQVVIGNEVGGVFRETSNLLDLEGQSDTEKEPVKSAQKMDFNSIMGNIAGIFTPFLSVLTAAGMVSAILVLLSSLRILDSSSNTYIVFSKIADAGFYYLPVLVAYTTASKMKCDKFLAVMLAGVLLHPSIMGQGLSIFGISIQTVSYNSTVVPAILTVVLMAYVEKLADKVSPGPVKFFLKPLLTVLITAPISLLILGPLGYNIGTLVAKAIGFLSNNVGFIAVAVLAAIYPLMVMTGMHHAYAPVALASIASLGYEGVMAPGALCANIAQGGAALAVFVRSKDQKVKSVAGPGGFSCLLGVSEPVMYGVTLQYRSALIATMVGGACGGLFAGITGVKAVALASPGLASIPIFMGETFLFALIAILIAFVVGFAVSFVTFKNPQ